VSFLKTEGSGVGVSKVPPVAARALAQAGTTIASNICFEIDVAEGINVKWNTYMVNTKLFVEVPQGVLPEGSKESFVALLEYAEFTLKCSRVIAFFNKDRNDRAALIRTFMFLGFVAVAPGNSLVPMVEGILFLDYPVGSDSNADDDSDMESGDF
jgi:ornithine decarboxylase antizyme 1